MSSFHLFISYSRSDNQEPVNQDGDGWVSAVKKELERRHQEYCGRELRIFLDTEAIDEGSDWRRRLGEGLRQSKLFLAFLSPNYITSKNCLWEWEEYLRREHSAARGDDGITPVFFIEPSDLRVSDKTEVAAWLNSMKEKYPFLKVGKHQKKPEAEKFARKLLQDLSRRQQGEKRRLELHPWIQQGPDILRELDAAERSAEVKHGSRDLEVDLRTLSDRLKTLGRHVSQRLDRIALADLAIGNLRRGHEHFVGRHKELRQLHDIMVTGGPQSGGSGMGGRGMIAATFAPGGMGKTALARQYAHAYAEFYAAGGIWEVVCEGVTELGAALTQLANTDSFKDACVLRYDIATQRKVYLTPPLEISDQDRADYSSAVQTIIAYLKRVTDARQSILLDEFSRRAADGRIERHCKDDDLPQLKRQRALLILDNVDLSELLSANQLALIRAEEWLEFIVTTRLHPSTFGGGDRTFEHVEVGTLPEPDAVELIADFQPSHRFASDAEEEAARKIVRSLGGWTIAVEIAAAFMGQLAKTSETSVQDFLGQLETNGLLWIDDLSSESNFDSQQRHSDAKDGDERRRLNRVGTLINWSIARLSAPAREALEFASLFKPDEIPLDWLRSLTVKNHPEIESTAKDSWASVWLELRELRLLSPVGEIEHTTQGVEKTPEVVSIHRLVAVHVSGNGLPASFSQVDEFLYGLAERFEQEVGQSDDVDLRYQHPLLFAQLEHLIKRDDATPTLLKAAGVFVRHEGDHGSLIRAIEVTKNIFDKQEEFLQSNPQSSAAARDVSVSLDRLGDFLVRRGQSGDLDQAYVYYERSLSISEGLLQSNPQSSVAKRDVSVSLSKLGDFLVRRGKSGDLDQAYVYYDRSLSILEGLPQSNPQSSEAARNVSVSLNKLGDFLVRRGKSGDLDQAYIYFERSLSIIEGLLQSNPQSSVAKRDVSVSLSKLGDFLVRRGKSGDLDQAYINYERSLLILEGLLQSNPQSSEAKRDVSMSLNELGDFLVRRGESGDLDQAYVYYDRSLSIRVGLLESNPQSSEAARDVSVSLDRLGDFLVLRGQSGDFDQAYIYYERNLSILKGLLQSNPQSSEAERDVSVSLSKLGDFLVSRGKSGDFDQAYVYYERSLSILEGLLQSNPQSSAAARDVSVSLQRLGDFLVRRGESGDLDQAYVYYERNLSILKGLLQSNPQSSEAERDVSVSFEKLGDFLVSRDQSGDFDQAYVYYERSLSIREGLLESNPQSSEAARDVSVSLNKLGDFLIRRGESGDLNQAYVYYERSLSIREGLLQSNPQSSEAARDVSVSQNKLGDFLVSRGESGDLDQAYVYYERSLSIREGLLQSNPQSSAAARDVSVSLNKLGDFLVSRGQSGDLDQAYVYYERSLSISEGLLQSNPRSSAAGRDVSVYLDRLGDFLVHFGQYGDLAQAYVYYERSLSIREGLLQSNPQSLAAARDVSVSLEKLGDFLVRRGESDDLDHAYVYYERSLSIREGLLQSNPQSLEAARDLSVSLVKLGDFLVRRGQSGDLAQAYGYCERSLSISEGLLQSNPQSLEAARDVVGSEYNLFQILRQMKKDQQAVDHLSRCYMILESFVREGRPMDSQLTGLYEWLQGVFKR